MSAIFDSFRATAGQLFEAFGTRATIVSAGTRTRDFVSGDIVEGATSSRSALASLGRRRVTADDGTTSVQTIAKSNVGGAAGDRFTIAGKTYTITDVEEVAPDGGKPMLYVLTLS